MEEGEDRKRVSPEEAAADERTSRAAATLLEEGIIDMEDVPNEFRARILEILRRRGRQAAGWTPEPPTEPGFYWVRTGTKLGRPCVICELVDGCRLMFHPHDETGTLVPEGTAGWTFWSERLEPPEV